jgi:ribosomal protein S18 acetylase RimI-like enzyme
MVIENISEKYAFCMATHKDIPELVRMRLKLQEHMEQVNNFILRYKDNWKNGLPLLYEKLLNNSNVIIIKTITKEDDVVVGMIVGTINEHPHFTIEKSVKIDDVWVDNEHRQKGICSQMLSDLLNRFSEQGIEHFTLNYVVNNLEAEQTWRALGFTPIIINSVVKII